MAPKSACRFRRKKLFNIKRRLNRAEKKSAVLEKKLKKLEAEVVKSNEKYQQTVAVQQYTSSMLDSQLRINMACQGLINNIWSDLVRQVLINYAARYFSDDDVSEYSVVHSDSDSDQFGLPTPVFDNGMNNIQEEQEEFIEVVDVVEDPVQFLPFSIDRILDKKSKTQSQQ